MAHLFVAVTAHGYGHLAQVAPIIHALRAHLPDLRITLQGDLDPAILACRLPAAVFHIAQPADVALPMDGPLRVRWELGLQRYLEFDAAYADHLQRQMALLADAQPDLLLADIPWLPLDAAHRLGIPAVGLCSLNWLDILLQSPVGARVPAGFAARLRAIYANAERFIRPAPSMPMPWLANALDVGPIAELRPRAAEQLRARLGLAPDQRLILMQFGGTGTLTIDPRPLERARLHLLTADPAIPVGPAVSRVGTAGLGMLDVLASCDALITKPGYGSFAEAACHGIPVLHVPRDDWPESPPLVEWLKAQVPTGMIAVEDLTQGKIIAPLAALLAQPRPRGIPPSGIGQTFDCLLPWLTR